MPVEVAVARTDTVVDAILATGQIEAVQSIELRPDIEGRIAQILVREGASWPRARRSSRWTTRSSRPQVARAEAERDLARQSLTRTRDLLAQKASSPVRAGARRGHRRGAPRRSSTCSRSGCDRTTVRAPFAGVAGQRLVSLGDYVTTDTTAAVAADRVAPAGRRSRCPSATPTSSRPGSRSPSGSRRCRAGSSPGGWTSSIRWCSFPGGPSWSRRMVPNPKRELQSGMFIEARLATAVRPNAVVIAEDAVLRRCRAPTSSGS